jgi:hypothetical protein
MLQEQGAQVSALTDPIGFHDDLFSLQTMTKLENSLSHGKRVGPFERMEIAFFARLLRLSSTHLTAKGGKQYRILLCHGDPLLLFSFYFNRTASFLQHDPGRPILLTLQGNYHLR